MTEAILITKVLLAGGAILCIYGLATLLPKRKTYADIKRRHMKTFTSSELKQTLSDHVDWLNNNGGERADLSYADLRHADLRYANLSYANLRHADLRSADLRSADLSHADLSYADLRHADLSHADLRSADLSHADLCSANLRHADLRHADLRSADLSHADLCSAENSDTVRYGAVTAFFALQCPEEGSFIGWKKARKKSIVKLRIPAKAKRSSATTRKCRASEAKVLAIFDREGKKIEVTTSNYDDAFEYKVGEIVSVENFDENRWEECASGIHFFITRKEAEQY